MSTPARASLVALAGFCLLTILPHPVVAGCTCTPATDCAGRGTLLAIALEAPVPNIGGEPWIHVAGSSCHCMPSSWYGDCFALDLGLNPLNLFDLDNKMPVLAAADGTVAVVDYSATAYGNRVEIDHVQGGVSFRTQYAHMDNVLLVVEGQTVRTGQVLGFISNSGTGANHLHFTVRTDGRGAAYTDDLNGFSMTNAHSANFFPTSDTDQFFEDRFEATNSGWDLTDNQPLTVERGLLSIPENPGVERSYKWDLHVGDANTYLFEYAVHRKPLDTAGSLFVYLEGRDLERPDNRMLLGTHLLATTLDTRQSWEAHSRIVRVADLPASTRLVRPRITTNNQFAGGADFSYMRFEENPPNTAGGNVRFHAYNRGQDIKVDWTITDPGQVTGFFVQRARREDGPYFIAGGVVDVDGTNYQWSDEEAIIGLSYFYKLEILSAAGSRLVGPIGPAPTYWLHDIPNLGLCKIFTDMTDIPSFAVYPDLSFDGNTNTYGLINYNPKAVNLIIVPQEGPVSLQRVRAHFGGNTNDWSVEVSPPRSAARIPMGSASNDFLEWSAIDAPSAFPGRIDAIFLRFQRTSGDQFFHNAELEFIP